MTLHALSQVEASAICLDLHDRHGIDVAVHIIDRVAHVSALRSVTTTEEVTALAAFIKASATPVHWHERRPT